MIEPSRPNNNDALSCECNGARNVRYVLSGQPTGWTAMAAKVREFDEERIKDTKEDVDTLLVFAGLFSAVLSAFLVESYQRLLPDTASQTLQTSTRMLVIMQQVSMQISNSSYPPALAAPLGDLETFRPSTADIRVNVLWFASLIFSLITASFGILVKQWLREYLAVDNPSPHARLRIRHHRYPGLAQWNVFEIAAILPLFQQLALALFFIGLCYFTASVHSSIGYTSLPLVAGWAFCFITVTVLPALFPRCPYKTALLSTLHVRLSRAIYSLSTRVYKASWSHLLRQRNWLTWLQAFSQSLQEHCSAHDETVLVTRDTEDIDILAQVDAIQSNDELLSTVIFESLQQIHDPHWTRVVKLAIHLLEHRLQGASVLSERPAPLTLDAGALTHVAYTSVINVISLCENAHFQSSLRTLDHGEGPQGFEKELATLTLHACYILFSPTPHPLPDSGVDQITQLFRYQGVSLTSILVRMCPEDRRHTLMKGIVQRAEDLEWSSKKSLQHVEAVLDATFCWDATVYNGSGDFKWEGPISDWPWDKYFPNSPFTRELTKWIAKIVKMALSNVRSSTDTTQSNTSDTEEAFISESGFVGSLATLCILVSRDIKGGYGGLMIYHLVVRQCFSHRASTLAILRAMGRTQVSAVIDTCRAFASGDLLYLTDEMLANFTDVVNSLELGVISRPSHSGDGGAPVATVTLTHALNILCFAVHSIHLFEQLYEPVASPHQLQALLDAVTGLVCRVIGVLPESDSASHSAGIVVGNKNTVTVQQQVAHAIRTSSPEDTAAFNALAIACLEHVQWQELMVIFPQQVRRRDDPAPEYRTWLPRCKIEGTLFKDILVELLGTLYALSVPSGSGAPDPVESLYRMSYRARRLGLRERLWDVYPMEETDHSPSGPPPAFIVQHSAGE